MSRYAVTHVKVGEDNEVEEVRVLGYAAPHPDGALLTDVLGMTVDDLIGNLVNGDTAFVSMPGSGPMDYVAGDRIVVLVLPGGREVLRSVGPDGQPTDALLMLPRLN